MKYLMFKDNDGKYRKMEIEDVYKKYSKFALYLSELICEDNLKHELPYEKRCLEDINEFTPRAIEKTITELERLFNINFDDPIENEKALIGREKMRCYLTEHAHYLYLNFCTTEVINSDKEKCEKLLAERRVEQAEWDAASPILKALAIFLNRETAPTLKVGYITLAILIFFEMFFTFRFDLIAATLGIFWMWRKKQLDIYNGRASKWNKKKLEKECGKH